MDPVLPPAVQEIELLWLHPLPSIWCKSTVLGQFPTKLYTRLQKRGGGVCFKQPINTDITWLEQGMVMAFQSIDFYPQTSENLRWYISKIFFVYWRTIKIIFCQDVRGGRGKLWKDLPCDIGKKDFFTTNNDVSAE